MMSLPILQSSRNKSLRLFRFHTWFGSGPAPVPFFAKEFINLGVDACRPLAVLATSRGRGA